MNSEFSKLLIHGIHFGPHPTGLGLPRAAAGAGPEEPEADWEVASVRTIEFRNLDDAGTPGSLNDSDWGSPVKMDDSVVLRAHGAAARRAPEMPERGGAASRVNPISL